MQWKTHSHIKIETRFSMDYFCNNIYNFVSTHMVIWLRLNFLIKVEMFYLLAKYILSGSMTSNHSIRGSDIVFIEIRVLLFIKILSITFNYAVLPSLWLKCCLNCTSIIRHYFRINHYFNRFLYLCFLKLISGKNCF